MEEFLKAGDRLAASRIYSGRIFSKGSTMFLHMFTHPRFLASLLMMISTVPPPAFGHDTNSAPLSLVPLIKGHESFEIHRDLAFRVTNAPIGLMSPLTWDRNNSMEGHQVLIPVAYTISKRTELFEKADAKSMREIFERDWVKPSLKKSKLKQEAMEGRLRTTNPGIPQIPGRTPDPVPEGMADILTLKFLKQLEGEWANFYKPTSSQITRRRRWGQKLFQIIKCNACHRSDPRPETGPHAFPRETHDLREDTWTGRFGWETMPDDFLGWQVISSLQSRIHKSGPYGYNGRNFNLQKIMLRHGRDAQPSWDAFSRLPRQEQALIVVYLQELVHSSRMDSAFHFFPGESQTAPFSKTPY